MVKGGEVNVCVNCEVVLIHQNESLHYLEEKNPNIFAYLKPC